MDQRKIIGTILGILIFIAAIAGLSYAMFEYQSTNTNTITGKQCFGITYTKGTNISTTGLDFVSNYTLSPIKTTVTFNQTSGCDAKEEGKIYIYSCSSADAENSSKPSCTVETSSNLLTGALKYKIEKRKGSTSATVESTYSGTITSLGDTEVNIGILENTTTYYTVYLYLEENTSNGIDSSLIAGATYSGYIHATARETSAYTN